MMVGKLVYVDAFGADPDLLDDAERLADVLQSACLRGRATVLRTHAQKFQPHGVTVVCLLAESHITLHTYPEDRGFMLDVFTCGDRADPLVIAEAVVRILGGSARYRQAERGGPSR